MIDNVIKYLQDNPTKKVTLYFQNGQLVASTEFPPAQWTPAPEASQEEKVPEYNSDFIETLSYLGVMDSLEDEQIEGLRRAAIKDYHYSQNFGYQFKRTETNPREKAFYEQWMKENIPTSGLNSGNGILQDLFINSRINGPSFAGEVIEIITPRDRRIVATVIQWLGSNVGMSFLQEALRRFGAHIYETQFDRIDGSKIEQYSIVDGDVKTIAAEIARHIKIHQGTQFSLRLNFNVDKLELVSIRNNETTMLGEWGFKHGV